jgi:hypothetical protein
MTLTIGIEGPGVPSRLALRCLFAAFCWLDVSHNQGNLLASLNLSNSNSKRIVQFD